MSFGPFVPPRPPHPSHPDPSLQPTPEATAREPLAQPITPPPAAEEARDEQEATARPSVLAPNPNGVPVYLANQDRWLLWRSERRVNRQTGEITNTKVPINFHTGKPCDVTAPASWTDYDRVKAALARTSGAWDGPGFALGVIEAIGEVVIGLDLDTCLGPDGDLAEWAQAFLAALRSYAEVSPGGVGIKGIARIRLADLPEARRLLDIAEGDREQARTRVFGDRVAGQHAPGAQLFLMARYFTVTGRHWVHSPEDVTLLSLEQIAELAALFGPKERRANGTHCEAGAEDDDTAPDEAALRDKLGAAFLRNPRLKERWEGGTQGLNDASRSGRDMSVVAFLVTEGFTKGETRAALRLFQHGKLPEEEAAGTGGRYFDRMWQATKAAPHPDPEPPPPSPDPEPAPAPLREIVITPASFVANAEQGERALIEAGTPVYRRLNKLVRPIDMELDAAPETIDGSRVHRKTHAPGLIPITQPILRQMLHRVTTWVKYDGRKRKLVQVAPSHEAAQLILDRVGFWPFPDINGIIGTPVMRPDGSILNKPGFDPATGLILHNPPPMPDFDHEPSRSDAEWSCMRLKNDLLSGFPFVDDASRSVALSGLITPIVRAAIKQTPMHGASAPLAGTGKSYLWDLVSYIANGAAMPVIAAGRDEAETEKRIVMLLLKALSMWSIDNVNGALEGDFLCQVISQPRIMPRKLGVSDGPDPDMLNILSTYSTGNNIRFLGDMPRRVIVARMDANMERPELRTFETQPHKLILADRGLYIADCLTIPLAYLLAGSPGRLPPLAGFEEWSDVVRSALVWVGCADPIETVATSDNPGQEQAAALFAAWPQGLTSYTTAELLEVAQQRDPATTDFLHPDLLAALQPIAKDRRGSLDAHTLGNWLRDHKDTVIGTLKLSRHGSKTRPSWSVASIVKGQPA